MNWDVFISHASEDKVSVARPLANRLKELGLRVWLDEYEIRVGESLSRKVAEGIANSVFGVVVLSPSFFAKTWTKRELAAFLSTINVEEHRVLPVRHGISQAEVARQNTLLADVFAIDTDEGLNSVATAIFDRVAQPNVAEAIASTFGHKAPTTREHRALSEGHALDLATRNRARLAALESLALQTIKSIATQEPSLQSHVLFSRENLIRAVDGYFRELPALRRSPGALLSVPKALAHTLKWVHLYPVLRCNVRNGDLRELSENAQNLARAINDAYLVQLVGYFLRDLEPGSPTFQRLVVALLEHFRDGTYSAPMAADWFSEVLLTSSGRHSDACPAA